MSRKLDAAIAEALGKIGSLYYVKNNKLYYSRNGMEMAGCRVPYYSTDGNAMLELIEETDKRGYELRIFRHMGCNIAEYDKKIAPREYKECKAIEGTMPLSVALAAYEALTGKEWVEPVNP